LKIENVELEVIGKEAFQENSQFSIINYQLKKADIVAHPPLNFASSINLLSLYASFLPGTLSTPML